jgi:hypothetical protein
MADIVAEVKCSAATVHSTPARRQLVGPSGWRWRALDLERHLALVVALWYDD